jgi:hypothetical protein
MAAAPAAAPGIGVSFSEGGISLSPAGMIGLQRSVGNAAVAGLMRSSAMARHGGGGALLSRRGPLGEAESEREKYDDAIEAKKTYTDLGQRGPEDWQSSTGLGGFNVSWDPESWAMPVILRGGVTFLAGMELVGGNAVARQPQPSAQAAADQINALPADQRAAAVADWQWADASKTTFLTKFQEVITKVWSGQHVFHCTKKYWEDLAALPTVSAEVHDGPKTATDHMQMSVYKVPTNFVGTVGVVNPGSGPNAATTNRMTLNSNDVNGRRDNILNVTTVFAPNSDELDVGTSPQITQFAIRFKSGGAVCGMCGNPIEAVGGVAINATIRGDGPTPEVRARSRFTKLTAALVAAGMADAATRLQFTYGGVGVTGDMRIGDGIAQVVAAHEAGHMFGLGDRYATTPGGGIGGTGPSAGLPSRHDQLAKDEGLEGAKAANDDGIMSWGNQVRPADYATFLEALIHLTGMPDWALGQPKFVIPPGEALPAGDFPTPPTDPNTAVA